MKPVVVETEIAAAPARVFAVFTDLAHGPERVRAIEALEVLTPGPVGQGTRFKETRRMFGKSATETMEFVEFEAGKHYTLGAESCGTRYRTSFSFEPAGAGTRVRMSFEATPLSMAAKMMAPMLGLMTGTLTKAIQSDFDDLKSFCEQRPAP
jgi:hypothetical protein